MVVFLGLTGLDPVLQWYYASAGRFSFW